MPTESLIIVAGQDTCRTDASGNYAFPSLPMGPLQLKVLAPGCDPLRVRFYLRREAFLPLELHASRLLATGFPADSVHGLAAFPVSGLVDLDRDGHVDAQGWLPLSVPTQALVEGLPRTDPWGGIWPESPVPDTWVLAPIGVHPLGHPGFFSARDAGPLQLHSRPVPAATRLWMGGSSRGQAELGAAATRALGSWHAIWAQGRAATGTQVDSEDQGLVVETGHDWVMAERLQFSQLLLLGHRELSGVDTELPAIWFPKASMESWRQGELRQSSVGWQGLVHWSPTAELRSDLLLWGRHRAQDAEGEEYDRVLNRLPAQDGINGQDYTWFQTKRSDKRLALGLRAALERIHERGMLQLALDVERQQRRSSGALLSSALVPSGQDPWLDVSEEQAELATRLRDRWKLDRDWHVEACLDLRYSYYELKRRRVGVFQLSSVPGVAFNQDLLSLDPRFALGFQPAGWQLEASWQRRQFLPLPGGWWDPDQSVESLASEPLLTTVGIDLELEALLPMPQVDQTGLACRRDLGPLSLLLGFQGRHWNDLALPFWTRREHQLDPAQLTNGVDASELGLDARMEWNRGGSAWLALQGAWREARLEGLYWQPLADSTGQWVASQRTLRSLPGVPRLAASLEAGMKLNWGSLSLDLSGHLRWQGSRSGEQALGWSRELPARATLDLDCALRLASLPDLACEVWGRNLGNDGSAQAAQLVWRTVERSGSWHELPAVGRSLGLRMIWTLSP